jgi:hypothetical protein
MAEMVDGGREARYPVGHKVGCRSSRKLQPRRMIMLEAALVFFGLVIVAIVNFLGLRQICKTIQDSKK